MCRTMNELEKVVADYRSLKALKAVQSIQNDLKQILDHWQNTSESASIEDYTLNKNIAL